MKQTFRYLNEIINKKKNRDRRIQLLRMTILRDISDPVEIANRFCHYFFNIDQNLAKKIPDRDKLLVISIHRMNKLEVLSLA